MARAYLSGVYTMKDIGDFFGVLYMTVSRTLRLREKQDMLECEIRHSSRPPSADRASATKGIVRLLTSSIPTR